VGEKMFSKFSLSGKVALVTGGSRGIGEACAKGLAKAGADVVVVSRKLSDLEKVGEEVRKIGRRSLAVAGHMGYDADIKRTVDIVKREFGGINILVNNAAANPTMDSALNVSEKVWDTIMNLNLKGLFFLSQAVARLMREQEGGSIINISSLEGIRPGSLLPVYSISKAGVIMATKVMAQEWGQYGIRVNAIAPGLVRTRFSEALWSSEGILESFLSKTAIRRIAEPEEVVGTVIYLASDASTYVTGTVVSVDGGQSI
jgi:NAD(P)-dependent dehydrogenase (short-subunit alcohol dehydrogenase family)